MRSADASIQAWMVQFADGERAAFQPLFDALWPVLLAFASRTLEPVPMRRTPRRQPC